MNKTLAAWTAQGFAYPPYINASEMPGDVVRVIVRGDSRGRPISTPPIAEIDMPRDAWNQFLRDAVLASLPEGGGSNSI